jgi:hypothetical protein
MLTSGHQYRAGSSIKVGKQRGIPCLQSLLIPSFLLLAFTLNLFLPNVLLLALEAFLLALQPFLLALKPIVLTHVEIDADGTPSPPSGADNQRYRDAHVGNLPAA